MKMQVEDRKRQREAGRNRATAVIAPWHCSIGYHNLSKSNWVGSRSSDTQSLMVLVTLALRYPAVVDHTRDLPPLSQKGRNHG